MQVSKFAVFLMLSSLSIAVFLTSSGCSQLSGFGSLSDGAASSSEMRKAAAIARAEADALDQIVAQQDAQFHQAVGATQEVASLLGAPEVASALIGAIAGILVPSPIKRKKNPA
tara:strand:- start:52 stop:393 length:342 start_codon:yes stop_codon:yes gene_type:complete